MNRRPPTRSPARRPLAAPLLTLALLTLAGTGAELDAQEAGGATVPTDADEVVRRADQARVKGDTAAPVRVIEVSDFQCPFCRQYFEQTFPALDSLYVETGRVEYVWMAFPNPSHGRAWPAIEAAYCAGAAGRFWPMHDTLFARQGAWSSADSVIATFVEYARSMDIDAESFRSCLVEDRAAGLIVRDYGTVSQGGVRGTPFFLIADSLSFQGAQPLDRFRSVLDSVLASKGLDPPE